jgi:hypothetical protein
MQLHRDHLSIGKRFEHTRFEQLREFDHRPEYQDVRVVPSESSDTAYLVARVSALPEPFDPDTTDVSADRREFYLCSCPGFHYHNAANFEDGENPPTEWGKDKHIIAAYRTENAKSDDAQETL